jgi:hypothetical protein
MCEEFARRGLLLLHASPNSRGQTAPIPVASKPATHEIIAESL